MSADEKKHDVDVEFSSPQKKGKPVRAYSVFRRFLSSLEQEDDDDGDGTAELKPPEGEEYEQRLLRRQEEEQFAKHVREAIDPADKPEEDLGHGRGNGMKSHPLLENLPEGTVPPREREHAAENEAAQIKLQRDLKYNLAAQNTSMPTPKAS
jgi:hypothetical protein